MKLALAEKLYELAAMSSYAEFSNNGIYVEEISVRGKKTYALHGIKAINLLSLVVSAADEFVDGEGYATFDICNLKEEQTSDSVRIF